MKEDFKTGDLLLCDYHGYNFSGMFSYLIKYFTKSEFSHVAIVLKDPDFINPPLKGLYVWESNWHGTEDPQDGRVKLGVQITPLEQFLDSYTGSSRVFYKKINYTKQDLFAPGKLRGIHGMVYEKPYDIVPKDWIEAYLNVDDNPQKKDRFWCSALVGFIYTMLGILPDKTDWCILRPSDFSDDSRLKFINCTFDNQKQII